MENKYYTPDIEDICVGYECERDFSEIREAEDWKPTIIEQDDFKSFFIEDIRVPYLTKEQIEAEGWKFKGKSVDLWWEKEGDFQIGNWTSYKIVMHYGMKGHVGNQDCRLYIYAEDRGDEHRLYEGNCPSINEFRKICKLLNIYGKVSD